MVNLYSKFVVYVLCVTLLFAPTHTLDQDEAAEILKNGVENYIQGRRSNALSVAFQVFNFSGLFRRTFTPIKNVAVCLACNAVAPGLITAVKISISKSSLTTLLVTLCVGMNIQTDRVCRNLIQLHIDTFLEIIRRRKGLTSLRLCSIVFQNYGCFDPFRTDWTVYIPEKTNKTGYYRSMSKQDGQNHQNLKILLLTDAHYSTDYVVGSNAVCGEPLCCESPSSPSSNPEDAAGKWGDYRNCDLSIEAMEDALNHIVTQHKDIDYVYYVGDIVDHKIWNTSISRNKYSISRFFDLIKTTFPSIPVLPVLGNHEAHPVNVFAPHLPNLVTTTEWLFDFTQEQWSSWLSDDTEGTILKGGFYTQLIKPGFRVISLNSNVCFIYNWWLIYDDSDPYDQLKWLVLVLIQAEKNNEKVHILSHIPSGDPTCLSNWGREYSRIVSRFSATITAQFNGHTHTIEKIIYFHDKKPVNVAFNGGSLTPYSNVNPNYALYSVNIATLEVTDYDVWIFDVAEANLQQQASPRWFKLFSFKDAYNVSSLRPSELHNLVKRMSGDQFLQDLYFRYKYKNATPSIVKGCDNQCKYVNLCNMVTSYYKIYNAECRQIL